MKISNGAVHVVLCGTAVPWPNFSANKFLIIAEQCICGGFDLHFLAAYAGNSLFMCGIRFAETFLVEIDCKPK